MLLAGLERDDRPLQAFHHNRGRVDGEGPCCGFVAESKIISLPPMISRRIDLGRISTKFSAGERISEICSRYRRNIERDYHSRHRDDPGTVPGSRNFQPLGGRALIQTRRGTRARLAAVRGSGPCAWSNAVRFATRCGAWYSGFSFIISGNRERRSISRHILCLKRPLTRTPAPTIICGSVSEFRIFAGLFLQPQSGGSSLCLQSYAAGA